MRSNKKKTIEFIMGYAAGRRGDELLSKIYINNKIKLKFKCGRKGHIFWMCWANYQTGKECKRCSIERMQGVGNPSYRGGVVKLNIPLYDTFAHQVDWYEEVRRDPENNDWLQVRCTNNECGKWFTPKTSEVYNRVYAVDHINQGACRFYCSEECKQSCSIFGQIKYPKGLKPDYHRHPDYTIWAKMIKERDNYECQICGETEGINAHHYEGLKVNDMQSLDLDMGVTLCKKCHDRVHSQPGCTTYDLQERNVCNQ